MPRTRDPSEAVARSRHGGAGERFAQLLFGASCGLPATRRVDHRAARVVERRPLESLHEPTPREQPVEGALPRARDAVRKVFAVQRWSEHRFCREAGSVECGAFRLGDVVVPDDDDDDRSRGGDADRRQHREEQHQPGRLLARVGKGGSVR